MSLPRATPKFELWRVQASISSARVCITSAVLHVQQRTGFDRGEADRYVRRLVARLHDDDFHETVTLKTGELGDVYGCHNDEGDWYVKVTIKDDGTHVLSCHPPEHAFTTVGGTRIKP